VLSIAMLAGCENAPRETASDSSGITGTEAGTPLEAVAVLVPTEGNQTAGSLVFKRDGDEIEVSGEIAGLSPGEHGLHVHELGNCDCPDGECAGPHFAPGGEPHGAPTAEKRHVGDLGNVTAGEDGTAKVEVEDGVLALDGVKSIIGRAVVVHAGKDDLTSQPSGNSGPRVACGVVGIAREETPKAAGTDAKAGGEAT
ncbi:MAG: superoxide dismutase family protein, partial [Candidatus Binatia bacterium]